MGLTMKIQHLTGNTLSAAVAIALLLLLLLPPTSNAETFETALNAYSEGNYTSALEILQRLAEKGEPRAQYNLGAIYDSGSGVEEDNEIAVKWYAAAAEQGVASAAFNLANMYREGQGVPQNYEQATRWYKFAASSGDASAQYNLGAMYENGYGTERNLEMAIEWYRQSAEQGLVHAQHRLGELYIAGEGVGQDPVTAYAWLYKAAIQGYSPAKIGLSSLEDKIGDVRHSIKGRNVNLRAEPSTDAGVISRLQNGQSVLSLASRGEWVKINVIGPKTQVGWVHSSLIK